MKNVYPGGIDLEAVIIPRNTARVQTFAMSLKDHGANAKQALARRLLDDGLQTRLPGRTQVGQP